MTSLFAVMLYVTPPLFTITPVAVASLKMILFAKVDLYRARLSPSLNASQRNSADELLTCVLGSSVSESQDQPSSVPPVRLERFFRPSSWNDSPNHDDIGFTQEA
jgi:hypothetical protein